MTNFLTKAVGAAASAIPGGAGVGIDYALNHVDVTPGFSAQNVATTQAHNAFSNAIGTNQPAATVPTINQSGQDVNANPSGAYQTAAPIYRSSTGGTYSSQAAADAADAAYYNGQLDQQQQIGLGNIGNAYNTSLNSLLGDQAIAQRNYDSSKVQGLQDYTQARGQNQLQTGQQANGLQRLLGAHGYNGSANLAAGYAAARQGSQQAQGLDQGYGRNMQALDTNFGDYNNKVKGQRDQLDQQKYSQENALKQQVLSSRQSLLSQLGNTGGARALDGQINALNAQYANPVLQATSPTYQAPSLESYTVNPNAAAQVAQPGAAGNISPAFATLPWFRSG
jgi:hypothetical protein